MNLRHPTLVALFAFACTLHANDLSPVHLDALTCEHLANPLGIGITQPRFSWKLRSTRPGEIQTAYQIHAAAGAGATTTNLPLTAGSYSFSFPRELVK